MKTDLKINEIHSGPRGWTKKLLNVYGEDVVRDYWIEHGNRETAWHFGVPVSTIDYLKRKYRWKRPMANAPHILLGVARGNKDPWDYPHLELKVTKSTLMVPNNDDIQWEAYYQLKKGTFIGWCLLNTGYTYCNDIYLWMQGTPELDWVETKDELIQAMRQYRFSTFEPRHYRKVEDVYTHYTNRDPAFKYDA